MKKMSERELRILEKPAIVCADVNTLLGDYVDNELSASLRDRIHQHIRLCPKCDEGEKRYREVIALARALPEKPVTENVRKRLREGLNRRLGISLPL